jgi:DNA-binding transcriptional ArsR family regulator
VRTKADAYAAVFTALAHPVRRRIAMTLHFEGGSMTAGEIAAMFEHAWPTTTKHLQVLQAAGIVRQTRDGRTRNYTLDRSRLALVRDWLAQLTEDRDGEKRRAAAVPHQRRSRQPR